MNKLHFILTFLLISFSCSQKQNEPVVLLPSDLNVEIEVSGSVEGLVNVYANANSANYYGIEFFHNNGSSLIESTDGSASYLYSETNVYKIIVRAHSSFDHYIEKEDSVSVSVSQNSGGIPSTGYITPLSYSNYDLVWNDEFDGTTLSDDWMHEIGSGNNGWGNNELQYYRSQNTEVNEGYLVITAKNEAFGGKSYTSSRIITRNSQSFQYGRIDIRAALPQGQGMWPALWMLGDLYTSVGWPASGEIDIMEMVGSNYGGTGNKTVYGTVHWDNNGQHAQFGGSNQVNSPNLSDEFHVYSIIWNSNSIKWYRDDIFYHQIDITPSDLSEFHEPFFLIFNLAVGGNWPGSPNANTQLPQKLIVDYVRVFQ